MSITDVQNKNGDLKSASAFADAIHWIDIQEQLKELTFEQFKEVIFPVIQHFQAEAIE